MLLPDQLKALCQRVERQELSRDEFQSEQDRLLATSRDIWQGALCLETHRDLPESLLAELGHTGRRGRDPAPLSARAGQSER